MGAAASEIHGNGLNWPPQPAPADTVHLQQTPALYRLPSPIPPVQLLSRERRFLVLRTLHFYDHQTWECASFTLLQPESHMLIHVSHPKTSIAPSVFQALIHVGHSLAGRNVLAGKTDRLRPGRMTLSREQFLFTKEKGMGQASWRRWHLL